TCPLVDVTEVEVGREEERHPPGNAERRSPLHGDADVAIRNHALHQRLREDAMDVEGEVEEHKLPVVSDPKETSKAHVHKSQHIVRIALCSKERIKFRGGGVAKKVLVQVFPHDQVLVHHFIPGREFASLDVVDPVAEAKRMLAHSQHCQHAVILREDPEEERLGVHALLVRVRDASHRFVDVARADVPAKSVNPRVVVHGVTEGLIFRHTLGLPNVHRVDCEVDGVRKRRFQLPLSVFGTPRRHCSVIVNVHIPLDATIIAVVEVVAVVATKRKIPLLL
ncbi:hypothetical protein HDU93_009620, partial [Gonapodya sp. JEL0774]